MAHDVAKNMIDAQEGKASAIIVMTFVGGVLLINAAIAQFIFEQRFYADVLGFAAALLLGTPLVVQAFKDLWSGHMHMDELAALAVLAAFAMGAKGYISGDTAQSTGFIEAGAIAFFMFISTAIEHRTALGARKSIESLVRLTPTKAHVLVDGEEREVEAKDLKEGDVVIVRPGDNIPGDGEVTKGESTVNQASITGESLPVEKGVGDDVFGGTINQTGVMEIRITKAGQDTTLGRVKDLILQAERTRIPAMRIMDRYAAWYTPTILMVVGIVFFFTKNPSAAIAMLVIACPCAIILATPTAMVASLSAAARLGVLVKNVTDLETARNLSSIVFDKTGTLTTGELSVTKLTPVEGVSGADLLRTAAVLEANSKHPVAKAVVDVAKKAKLNLTHVDGFEEVAGKGVMGKVDGKMVMVGREAWVREQGVDLSGVDVGGSEGLSLLFVAHDGKAMGWVGLEDKTREDAAAAMDELRELNIKKLVMVTGDRWSVAKRVAGEMHCTDVQAEVLPSQKLELVEGLKEQGHKVAVVGDGVNDAPALAAGDISVAMGAAGSDVAIHSARVALMNNQLNRIPFLVKLSRTTFGVVRQNLAFSLAYIVVFESLAALGYIKPIVAVMLHLVSSFVVIFNSARLVREGEDLGHVEVGGEKPSGERVQPVAVAAPA